ncbi:MAG: hypothetical protein DI551_07085 [Micavibrio aeruginosavorus]|uniref:Restriction endonuclease type IV Mrr domain-containing protein n=1 Tax=Micavibrio aeruginosavorus TaxID=349221 RepID=A0A2W5MZG9_9BACT|nr:MAG: hypothetical protein DI551_07085 [Micavibrio aeruginosavorus]
MENKFFDTEPQNWQELEDMIRLAFAEMGYEIGERKIKTVRGNVTVDVHAIKTSTPIPTIILCECKYWNKRVSQDTIHAFRTVCSDIGAHFGIIISQKGFLPGAEKSRISTNIHLMDFAGFQKTFLSDWRLGAMVMLAKMHDQMLPIFRAKSLMEENGLDVINIDRIKEVNPFEKYSMFFGLEGGYSSVLIESPQFPFEMNDPRGNPKKVKRIIINSYRQYIDIAKMAVKEATKNFNLPAIHFNFDRK